MTARAVFAAYVVTCDERRTTLEATLGRLRATDWGEDPALQLDDGRAPDKLARIHATWLAALERVAAGTADFALVLEDDLDFNVHLRHNLTTWEPLLGRDGRAPFFGSIYNAGRPAFWRPARRSSGVVAPGTFFMAHPGQVWGAQAVLMSRVMASYFLAHWKEETGAADLRMPRLAARLAPVYFHVPSLVQHVGAASTWGGPFHQAPDFDPAWRSPGRMGSREP